MKTKLLLKSFAIAAALTILIGSTIPQDANAEHRRQSIVGSWTIEGTPNQPGAPSFVNLGSIHRDGTVVNSDPVFGSGNGIWRRVGPRSFEVKFLTLVPPNDPFFPPNTLITVRGEITVNRRGRVATGTFDTTFEDENGNLLLATDGTVTFTRIRFD